MCPECGSTEFDTVPFYLGAIEAHLATCQECGCCDWLSVFEREEEEDNECD